MKKVNVNGYLKTNEEIINYNVIGNLDNDILEFTKEEKYQLNLKTGNLYRFSTDTRMSFDLSLEEITYILDKDKELKIPFKLKKYENKKGYYCLEYSIDDNNFLFTIIYEEV